VPRISVILPTRDRGHLLPRALESVFAQTERDWEIVLVDNNQNEPPVAEQRALERWLSDPRVRVVRPAAVRNAAMARNAGLAAAGGEWITYLDDDDAYRPSKLARQLERAQAESASLVLCGAVFILRNRTRAVQVETLAWRGDDMLLRARWNTPLLFHRRLPTRFFDEELSPGEDAEFGHRLMVEAKMTVLPVVPEPLVEIHPQPGPRVNANAPMQWRAAEKILAFRGAEFSTAAQQRFALQAQLGQAKLRGRTAECVSLGTRLLLASGGRDWRACANALVVSAGFLPGRWVS
jgi:hypothetical protein